MIPVIPVLIALGVGSVAVKQYRGRQKNITEERKKVFEGALRSLKDPEKLRKLANTFEKEGLRLEAKELRKRADILDAPASVKKARKNAFKAALNSRDPKKVGKVADAFQESGYYKAAAKLRTYLRGLTAKVKGAAVAGEPDFERNEDDEFMSDEFDFDTTTEDFVAEHDDIIETTSEDVEPGFTQEEADAAHDEEVSENDMMHPAEG